MRARRYASLVRRSTATLVYWGLSLFPVELSADLGKDKYVGFFSSGLIEVPAGIIGPLLLSWYSTLLGARVRADNERVL